MLTRCPLPAMLLLLLLLPACSEPPRTQVVVLGMIHRGHATSEQYGIDELKAIVRRIRPDVILCEIPPERLAPARREYADTGTITESRVKVFPEYVDAIIPLSTEIDFEMIGCAGWTQVMADERRERLAHWATERPEDTRVVDAAQEEATRQIHAGGAEDDPRWIHTSQYDAIVKRGLEPYNRLFNDDLGPGGWDNINAAHYALIAAALDKHRGSGSRVLVTFGSWHKYWILEQLRMREDVEVLEPAQFFAP